MLFEPSLIFFLTGFAAKNTKFPQQGKIRKWMWQQKGLLDALCHATSELALLYRTAEASQRSPEVDSTEVSLLSKAVLQVSQKLEVCKNLLDEFLVPRSESVGSRPLQESWPLLITPDMHDVLMKNFGALITTEALLQEVCRGVSGPKVPGLSSLQLLFSRALDMSNNFEEEFASTTSSDFLEQETSLDIAPFTQHYDKIVTEILLAVQNLRSNSSAAQESASGDSELAGTIQDVDHSICKKMLALRLGKIYDLLLMAISAGKWNINLLYHVACLGLFPFFVCSWDLQTL